MYLFELQKFFNKLHVEKEKKTSNWFFFSHTWTTIGWFQFVHRGKERGGEVITSENQRYEIY